MDSKVCACCGREFQTGDFHRDKGRPDGRHPYCRFCMKAKHSPEGRRRRHLDQYGLTPETYDDMLREQSYRCVICSTDISEQSAAAVDHCHTSGRIRGLLCRHCNLGLGHFFDDTQRLQAAVRYLTPR